MNCGVCGAALEKVVEARIGRYRGETVEVQSEFMRCKDCREEFFTPTQIRSHARTVKNEVRKRHGLLPPEKIAEIRTNLKLTQEELEQLLGAGPKMVVRWESGKVIQGRSADTVLRLLDRDPTMIEKLRQIQQSRHNEQNNYKQAHNRNRKMIAQAL